VVSGERKRRGLSRAGEGSGSSNPCRWGRLTGSAEGKGLEDTDKLKGRTQALAVVQMNGRMCAPRLTLHQSVLKASRHDGWVGSLFREGDTKLLCIKDIEGKRVN
jgi:hypothetical protein